MGVKDLTRLLDTNRSIYREAEFRRQRLVVDGCNLLFLLYLRSDLDQNHGGDYAAFEEEIEKFVTALRLCEIEPYVVMDGGSGNTNNKMETKKQRAEGNIRNCHQAAVEGTRLGVLPLCSKMVFVQTLDRLKVPLAQCYGEADQQIAALASEWQCPVLSNDSDFFIFDLPAGLLPISHFQWKALEQNGSSFYIPCKSYHRSRLCTFFHIQPQLLPTFAALAGNDYLKLERMKLSIRWDQFDPTLGEKPNRLRGLLSWLSGFLTPQEAREAALGLMGNLSSQRKAEVLENLTLGMEMYQLPPSSLETFFIHGITPLIPAAGEEVGDRVPDWMCRPLMQARLSGDILDVLQLQRKGLHMPVDSKDMPSAALTSRPLRQLMYGLLLGRDTCLQVEEWDRDGLQLKFILVQPDVRSVTRRLELRSLNKVEQSERLQVILQALKVTERSLSRLPPQLRLPVAVTRFWLQNAQPAPDKVLLKSLLLWLSDGDALRHAAVLQPENPHQEPKLDLNVAHAFNQWQMCLKDSVQLNHLLSCPLPEQHIARWYEGTLVHRLVHRMRTIGDLRDILKGDLSNVRLYKSMLSVVHRSQKALRKTQKTALWRQPLDNLQQLSVQYEDQEAATEMKSFIRAQDDLSLDDVVMVKTRYKTRERNNRCKQSRGRDLL
ncbi:protein asteroid homolog 1 [Hippoglossus hippoglossus]|uniref:protein asteroid homolog 1 n=1 Tax=Hippoglossus hippoglossus TaxID=8267 RepID=UPI00148BD59B|nr:protein asteroid homolog 1 [Hippoglossus hippoglossus]